MPSTAIGSHSPLQYKLSIFDLALSRASFILRFLEQFEFAAQNAIIFGSNRNFIVHCLLGVVAATRLAGFRTDCKKQKTLSKHVKIVVTRGHNMATIREP